MYHPLTPLYKFINYLIFWRKSKEMSNMLSVRNAIKEYYKTLVVAVEYIGSKIRYLYDTLPTCPLVTFGVPVPSV